MFTQTKLIMKSKLTMKPRIKTIDTKLIILQENSYLRRLTFNSATIKAMKQYKGSKLVKHSKNPPNSRKQTL